MKKTISLLLALALCLSLCACGAKSKASSAPFVDLQEYRNTYYENQANAKSEYDGNTYRYTGIVTEIHDNYCYAGGDGRSHEIQIFLDKDDLAKLSRGQAYTFAGKFKVDPLFPSLKNAVLVD